MHAFWVNHRWAIATFATICAGIFAFQFLVNVTASYYASHSVIIPLWARTLMVTGAFVRLFSLPITLVAAIVLFGISLTSSRTT